MPVTCRGGLYVCELSKILHCLDNPLADGGEVVSLTRRQSYSTRNIFWNSFLLEPESTPGTWSGWKQYINVTEDSYRWRTVVDTVMNFRIPYNTGNFLTEELLATQQSLRSMM
jgi:hypothetical protein